jgi:transposase
VPFERTITSEDLRADRRDRRPSAEVPRVGVRDNGSLHVSKVVKAARPGLAKSGIFLYDLPSYRPEWNRIESIFKQLKHHEMPVRRFATKAQLRQAVEEGFERDRLRLQANGDKPPRRGAQLD